MTSDEVIHRMNQSRVNVFTTLTIALATNLALAQGDATALRAGESDPMGWIGSHQIAFTAVASENGAALISGPDPSYPVLKRLAANEPLLCVGNRNDHLAVLVPEGYRAYVKREFVSVGDDGTGTILGDSVNLRSRPGVEGDYPIGRLESGRRLEVIGPADAEEAWLEVMAPGDMPLWVSDEDVLIEGDLTPEFRARVGAARARRHAEWVANSIGAKEAATRRARDEELRGRLDAVDERIRDERERGADADFTAIRSDLTAIASEATNDELRGRANSRLADLDTDEKRVAREREMRAEAERLRRELELEKQRLADAQRAAAEDSRNTVIPKVSVGDRDTISAFLRRKGEGANSVYTLERGNSVVARLICSSNRYRLDDFVGVQIEVTGRYSGGGTAPTLDAERLVVRKR
jgi:hypothetical protein